MTWLGLIPACSASRATAEAFEQPCALTSSSDMLRLKYCVQDKWIFASTDERASKPSAGSTTGGGPPIMSCTGSVARAFSRSGTSSSADGACDRYQPQGPSDDAPSSMVTCPRDGLSKIATVNGR